MFDKKIIELSSSIKGLVPFWFLNGEISRAAIEWEMDQMLSKGITEMVIHPRYGLSIPYLSEEYWELIGWCIESAKKRGMRVWLYDELNWPSGTAGLTVQKANPDFVGKYLNVNRLVRREIDLQAFEMGDIVLAGLVERGCILEAAILKSPEELESVPADWTVFNCAIKKDPAYIDTLNPAAVRHFRKVTHEEYYKRFKNEFGRTIRAIFTDEPSIYWVSVGYDDWNLPYTNDLFDTFKEKYGYDAIPRIPNLFYLCAETRSFRADFWEHVSNLFNERYHGTLANWCHAHGVIYTGHGHHEEPIRYQIRFSGDLLSGLRNMSVPGVDHLGKATLGNQWISIIGHKLAASAAAQECCPRVMSESFGCMYYDTTFLDLKKVVDWQFSLGVNLIVPHAIFHTISSLTKREAPPSFFFQSPLWEDFDAFSEYLNVMTELLAGGKPVQRVLVLYPITALWAAYQTDRKTDEFEFLDNWLNSLCIELMKRHIDFSFVDYRKLQEAKVSDGKIVIGNLECDILLIPPTQFIRQSEQDILNKLADQDVKVNFFYRTGETASENLPPTVPINFVRTGDMEAFLTDLQVFINSDVDIAGPDSTSVNLFRVKKEGFDVSLIVNRRNSPAEIAVRVRGFENFCLIDPSLGGWKTGSVQKGNRREVYVKLNPFETIFLLASANDLHIPEGIKEIKTPLTDFAKSFQIQLDEQVLELEYNVACLFKFRYFGSKGDYPDYDVRTEPRFIPVNWDATNYRFEEYAGVYETDLVLEKEIDNLRLVVDKDYADCRVFLNGVELMLKKSEAWITDPEDLDANLDGFLHTGKNVFKVESPTKLSEPLRIVGSFAVKNREAPVTIQPLSDSHDPFSPEECFPFFSGTATYSAVFQLPKIKAASRLVLRLGDVRDTAAVYLNGKLVGKRLWPPYDIELTGCAKPGVNRLRIEVRNNLSNILYGNPRPFGLRNEPQLLIVEP